jgi:bifunctional DNA-binding transcriptional regulator/antitoxin component of YhaV-PrlF toxin-antitoxin module
MRDVTISPEGNIALPEAALEALSVKPGDKLRFFIYEGEVRVLAVRPVSRLYGALPYDGPAKSLEEMEEGITQAVTERALR